MPTFQGATYIRMALHVRVSACLAQQSRKCSVCSETCTACDYTRFAKETVSRMRAPPTLYTLVVVDGKYQLTLPSAAAGSMTMMIRKNSIMLLAMYQPLAAC
jgi:hypothetical protein